MMFWWILVSIALLLAPPVRAEDAAAPTKAETDQPPMILRHSLTEFAVHQGDEVTLTVVPGGKDVQVRWEKEGHIFCWTPACTINTGNMGFGTHRLMVVLTNPAGNVHLAFSLRIVVAPVDHRPSSVSPRVVDGQDLLGTGPDDWTIRLQSGRASIEVDAATQRKSRAIGPLASRLVWLDSPKIVTGAQSQVQLGRSGVMEVQALADSELSLLEIDEGREITMSAGTLRVRRLDDSASATTIHACGAMSVKLETHADALVSCFRSESAQISVLRGTVKVERLLPGEITTVAPEPALTVGYGQTLVAPLKFEDKLTVQPIDTFKIQPFVVATSRDLLPEALGEWQADGPYRLLLPRSKDANAAKVSAHRYVESQEYLSAIETLAPFASKLAKDGEATLLMARAYGGLFLYDEALAQMREAIKMMPDSPMPHYEIGRLFASVSKWKLAAKAFDAADQRHYPNQKDLQFRRGEALIACDDPREAIGAYKRVLWYPPVDAESVKSRAQIEEITDQNLKTAYARLGLFYDSAILRVADTKLNLGDGVVRSNYGSGYQADAGLSLWPYRSADGSTEIALEASWRDFLKPVNRELATAKQSLRFASEMSLGGERPERFFTVGIHAALIQEMIGSVPQLSRVTAGASVGSPWLQKLRLGILKSFVVDPSPGRVRFIEPIRWELGQAGDFAALQSLIELSGEAWARGDWRMTLKLLSRTTAYRADFMRGEDFADKGAVISVIREPNARTALKWQLSQTSRYFARSSDARRDSDIVVAMAWDYYFTPDVKQSLEASYEMQSSTRSANQFKRKYASYQVQLDL
ncbi:MAG: hypothetical protein RL011_1932 [Pseudomonadota bacterium]|jgi:tetratricopeptide (TPR) repeat protein